MEKIVIREIRSDELNQYRAFLNKGLISDEENFRITASDDALAPFPTSDQEDSFTLGAFVNGQMAGVISFARDGRDREKLRHKGILFRMYVSSEFRGRGISKLLIESLLVRVRNIGNIEQINLTVISNNMVAKNLYEAFGFKTFSSEKNAIKWKEKYFDEDTMVLPLYESITLSRHEK